MSIDGFLCLALIIVEMDLQHGNAVRYFDPCIFHLGCDSVYDVLTKSSDSEYCPLTLILSSMSQGGQLLLDLGAVLI